MSKPKKSVRSELAEHKAELARQNGLIAELKNAHAHPEKCSASRSLIPLDKLGAGSPIPKGA